MIIFAGACPGIGKSTLSSYLYKQLKLAGVKSRWFYEEDVSDEEFFSGVTEAVLSSDLHVLDILLQAARNLVEGALQSEEIFITDSLLPFINWLFSINFDTEKLPEFSRDLEKVLAPANPLMVYLTGDIETSFRRALTHRGEKYGTDFLGYMAEWKYFSDKGIQPSRFEEIIAYFEASNQLNLDLLAEWQSTKLIFNTTSTGLAELKQTLLERLGLAEKAEPPKPDPSILQKFTGIFRATGESVPQTMQITFKGPDLWVDTYWPDGCRLHSLNATDFQLQDTSHYLLFEFSPEEEISGFTYRIGAKEYGYVKEG